MRRENRNVKSDARLTIRADARKVSDMDDSPTAPSACTSPGADASPSDATPAAGVQTEGAVVTAEAHGTGTYPTSVVVTIDGVAHAVDVTPDRDDWTLPDCETVDAHRVLWAIDDAIEAYLLDTDSDTARRIERVWARSVA